MALGVKKEVIFSITISPPTSPNDMVAGGVVLKHQQKKEGGLSYLLSFNKDDFFVTFVNVLNDKSILIELNGGLIFC